MHALPLLLSSTSRTRNLTFTGTSNCKRQHHCDRSYAYTWGALGLAASTSRTWHLYSPGDGRCTVSRHTHTEATVLDVEHSRLMCLGSTRHMKRLNGNRTTHPYSCLLLPLPHVLPARRPIILGQALSYTTRSRAARPR